MHFRSNEDIGPLSPLAVSLAAGFSGSIAAAASHSFDTAKSRSQCVVLPKVFHFTVKQQNYYELKYEVFGWCDILVWFNVYISVTFCCFLNKVVLIGFLFFTVSSIFVNHV